MSSDYWLYRWVDSRGISSIGEAEGVLSEPGTMNELHESAEQEGVIGGGVDEKANAILAGRGIDLSGYLDCRHPDCRKAQVDRLFAAVWHYFDQIVVDDPITHFLAHHAMHVPREVSRERVLSTLHTLLYLRKIGAEPLVVFRQKPLPFDPRWIERATDAGLPDPLERALRLADVLVNEASIVPTSPGERDEERWMVTHPDLAHSMWVSPVDLAPIPAGFEKGERRAAFEAARELVAHLTVDLVSSTRLGLPLGSTVGLYDGLLQPYSLDPAAGDVAFQIDLPYLDGIEPRRLLEFRRDESDLFQRFRTALRLAIQERLRGGTTATAAQVGEEIGMDVIEPELRRIRDRLKAARSARTQKLAIGAGLGALATTVGLIAGLGPASLVGLVFPIAAGKSAFEKHIDESTEVELSDMYFLWKAAHVHGESEF